MKKFMVALTGVLLAAAMTACAPTENRPGETRRSAPPAGAVQESTVDGALEKEQLVVDEKSVTVCVYSVNEAGTGLKQNMDAVDGETLDAQALINKMAELGVVEEGIEVVSFADQDGALTLELSSLKGADDKMVITALANTFIQNYEAKELSLSVGGQRIGDGPMTFQKEYKKMK